jgi:tRNA1Val (adenine37-N6)-methyltransferase
LIEAADLFLSENGIFAVIIPLKKKKISWPQMNELYPIKLLVKGNPTTEIKAVFLL